MADIPIPLVILFPLLLLHQLLCTHSFQFTTQRPFFQLHHPIAPHQETALTDKPPPPLSPGDLAALRAIKTSLHDLPGSDFFSTWDFDSSPSPEPCSSFSGVLCSTTDDPPSQFQRVTSLALGTGLADSPGLAGTFPSALSSLNALTQLILFAGRVSGPIPFDLGEAVPSLRFISITNNLVSGPIPPSLANLRDLHTLDLGHNRLSGEIPPALCTLPNLKVLILASNGYLSGVVPDVVSPLLHLDVRGNALMGPLPSLPLTLRYLSASNNFMSGTLDHVADLPNLAFLDLAMNAFSGPIPPSLFSPSIPLLLLQRNNLSGTMPPATRTTTTPAALAADGDGFAWGGWTVDISHNRLSGEVTAALAGAESVYINNNRFVGAVPSEYARSVYAGTMRTFYAQHNFLTGFDFPLPAGAAPLPESVSVCLAYNCMAPPPVVPTVCPASAGEVVTSRPLWQCAVFNNGTAADAMAAGGGGGGGR